MHTLSETTEALWRKAEAAFAGGLTAKELALRAGVCRRTLYTFRVTKTASARTMLRIERALHDIDANSDEERAA